MKKWLKSLFMVKFVTKLPVEECARRLAPDYIQNLYDSCKITTGRFNSRLYTSLTKETSRIKFVYDRGRFQYVLILELQENMSVTSVLCIKRIFAVDFGQLLLELFGVSIMLAAVVCPFVSPVDGGIFFIFILGLVIFYINVRLRKIAANNLYDYLVKFLNCERLIGYDFS